MRDLGVVGYLRKPFRPEELRDEVDGVLQMRGLLEQPMYAAVEKAATRVLETMFFCCTSNAADAELNTAEYSTRSFGWLYWVIDRKLSIVGIAATCILPCYDFFGE